MLLNKTSFDILDMTETKLANDTTDKDIGIEGYFTIQNDHDRNCARVLWYYKDSSAAYNEQKMEVQSTVEGVWIGVKCQSQTWLIVCVYRMPMDLSFCGTFNIMLEKLWSTRKNIVNMGDQTPTCPFKRMTMPNLILADVFSISKILWNEM